MGLTRSVEIKRILGITLVAFGLGISSVGYTQSYQQYPGAVQVATNYGTGRYSVEELAQLAQVRGLKILVLGSQVLQNPYSAFWRTWWAGASKGHQSSSWVPGVT